MKYQVVGVARKNGNFVADDKREIAYDNVVLHCVCNDALVEGQAVETLKLKTVDFGAALVSAAGGALDGVPGSLSPLVGRTVSVDYNQKGRIIHAELCK